MNFAIALLIAQEKGHDYWVELDTSSGTWRYQMCDRGTYICQDNDEPIDLDGGNNHQAGNPRIVRNGDEWQDVTAEVVAWWAEKVREGLE